MKIKHTLIMIMLVSGLGLLAREPFLLKKADKGSNIFKTNASPVEKKKMYANVNGVTNAVIKLNLSQIAIKNLSFQAEYGFHNKMSAAVGVSFLMNRSMGNLYNTSDEYEDNFSVPTLKGFALTPEFRFYPGGNEEKPAPRGFYIAAYGRYAKYKISQEVSYQETPSSTRYSATASQTYAGMTGGLMIGNQWIIGDHFSIDFWIIGGGYGKAKYTYSWVAPAANLNAKQQQDVKDQANENFDGFSAFGLDAEVETTKNSATMTVKGVPMISLRGMGLCFGFCF